MKLASYAIFVSILAAAFLACGNGSFNGNDGGVDGSGDSPWNTGKQITAIVVQPASASVEILNGAIVTAAFTASATFSDGSSQSISPSWTSDSPLIGAIDASGTFTPSGLQGGLVTITASYQGKSGNGTLAVKIHDTQIPLSVTTAIQTSLKGATTPDGTVVWAYPYDKTAFPRGLGSVPLMWNNGGAADVYYVHLSSTYYELEVFTLAPPPSQYALPDAEWTKFVDSTAGQVDLIVARWNGTVATQVIHHTWTIASASLRGTVYYWANNTGRIMRVQAGASAPDDFTNGIIPAPGNGCTMACHTVSADGSTLVGAGGTYGGSYDLLLNKGRYALGGTPDSAQIRQWGLPAVSPDGKYMVVNALAGQLTGLVQGGMFATADGTAVTTSGIPNERMYMPAFAPDGSSLVFVTGSNAATGYWDSTGTAGVLKLMSFSETSNPMLSNETLLVQPGSDATKNVIAWPTVSPDGKWVLYSRLGWVDPAGNHNLSSFVPIQGDLYIADTGTGAEARLANLDGDGYPFAAGARDLHYNFEPSLAPVAAGGYFWVVFHSRRTYGNISTGAANTVKQLWVAAIDQNPTAGKDPSHPAFRLPGQDISTLNLRGYFALNPCKSDGQTCQSGTDCCGGYCDPSPDGGAPVCGPKNGCSHTGDHCDTNGDCCNSTSGVTCINHVCSEPTPN